MKIKFDSTFPGYVEFRNVGFYYYRFSILPSFYIDNRSICFHWLFWGISIYK